VPRAPGVSSDSEVGISQGIITGSEMTGTYIRNATAISSGVRVGARSGARQMLAHARDERGQALLEFALILPLLLTLLLGIVMFGIVFNQYLTLTNATATGAQLLSISRGQTTDPCQTTSQAVYAAAPTLTQANLKFTIVLNGTTVANNVATPSCSTGGQYLVASRSAQVTVTYPCTLKFFGFNPPSNCILTAQTTEIVQ
jgi:Flp pilus assembly protein TadG